MYSHNVVSYYGRLNNVKIIRSLADDLISQRKQMMMQELREMEERLKRHVTECKREVIREIIGQPTKKEKLKKEKKEKKDE